MTSRSCQRQARFGTFFWYLICHYEHNYRVRFAEKSALVGSFTEHLLCGVQ